MNNRTVEIVHYGVKGMKWGVRRYQYSDGTLTPAGKRKYSSTKRKLSPFKSALGSDLSYAISSVKTKITGKQYVDSVIKARTEFSRIQTSKEFENFAFYATYLQKDRDKYLGLFGKNLKDRAERDAKNAEKKSLRSGAEEDIQEAKRLREKSDKFKVYQLKISSVNKLKVPSDENASDITVNLMRNDKEFRNNLLASIEDSKTRMRRPSQRMLFNHAERALRKDVSKMSNSEKIAIYKAFNLSLTNHNEKEIAAQDRFYKELKKKGYNALLDYNDKEYSSYHAKRPMIVFDLDSVKLKSVSQTNPAIVEKMYSKYNRERIRKEVLANTVDIVKHYGGYKVSEATSYVQKKVEDYLNR